jgi:Flp pilus assembly protein TadG
MDVNRRSVCRGLRTRRRETGTSTVEMVIVTPVLLLLVFGIAELGIAFAQWQTVSNAVREGARLGVVFRDPATCNPGTVLGQVQTTVVNYSATMGVTLAPGSVNATGLCTGSGTPVSVQATFPYTFQVLPNVQGLFTGGSVPGVLNFVLASTMRNE